MKGGKEPGLGSRQLLNMERCRVHFAFYEIGISRGGSRLLLELLLRGPMERPTTSRRFLFVRSRKAAFAGRGSDVFDRWLARPAGFAFSCETGCG